MESAMRCLSHGNSAGMRGDLVSALDPTMGSETHKTRPSFGSDSGAAFQFSEGKPADPDPDHLRRARVRHIKVELAAGCG